MCSSPRRQGRHFAATYEAFEKGKMTELGHAGPSSSPLKVRAGGSNTLTPQAAASSPEKDLIAIYSSVVQGVKAEVSSLLITYR